MTTQHRIDIERRVFVDRKALSHDDACDVLKMLSRYKRALENLTPHGSEFVDEPERCAEYVSEQLSRWRQRHKDAIIAARATAKGRKAAEVAQ